MMFRWYLKTDYKNPPLRASFHRAELRVLELCRLDIVCPTTFLNLEFGFTCFK